MSLVLYSSKKDTCRNCQALRCQSPYLVKPVMDLLHCDCGILREQFCPGEEDWHCSAVDEWYLCVCYSTLLFFSVGSLFCYTDRLSGCKYNTNHTHSLVSGYAVRDHLACGKNVDCLCIHCVEKTYIYTYYWSKVLDHFDLLVFHGDT